jgi:hypothetical protein
MSNVNNKSAKRNWKGQKMAILLAESLLKGEVSPLDNDLRDHAKYLYRNFIYGKATPCRRYHLTPRGVRVGRVKNRMIIRRQDGMYILAPLSEGRKPSWKK